MENISFNTRSFSYNLCYKDQVKRLCKLYKTYRKVNSDGNGNTLKKKKKNITKVFFFILTQ